jgi:hypothetical protein
VHSNSARSSVARHERPSGSASRRIVSARSMTTRSGQRLLADVRTCVVQGDGDRADGMAEQPEIGEGGQVGNAILPVPEGDPDGEVKVVGGGRGMERAEGRMA